MSDDTTQEPQPVLEYHDVNGHWYRLTVNEREDGNWDILREIRIDGEYKRLKGREVQERPIVFSPYDSAETADDTETETDQ